MCLIFGSSGGSKASPLARAPVGRGSSRWTVSSNREGADGGDGIGSGGPLFDTVLPRFLSLELQSSRSTRLEFFLGVSHLCLIGPDWNDGKYDLGIPFGDGLCAEWIPPPTCET